MYQRHVYKMEDIRINDQNFDENLMIKQDNDERNYLNKIKSLLSFEVKQDLQESNIIQDMLTEFMETEEKSFQKTVLALIIEYSEVDSFYSFLLYTKINQELLKKIFDDFRLLFLKLIDIFLNCPDINQESLLIRLLSFIKLHAILKSSLSEEEKNKSIEFVMNLFLMFDNDKLNKNCIQIISEIFSNSDYIQYCFIILESLMEMKKENRGKISILLTNINLNMVEPTHKFYGEFLIYIIGVECDFCFSEDFVYFIMDNILKQEITAGLINLTFKRKMIIFDIITTKIIYRELEHYHNMIHFIAMNFVDDFVDNLDRKIAMIHFLGIFDGHQFLESQKDCDDNYQSLYGQLIESNEEQ